ncbi:MAG TPA: hypothetical protein DCY93_03430 [Firmicutes bacterium]|nr:hypothetical protein [Bacillota bacterium]
MEVKYCPYCGTKLEEDASLCSHCGAEINFVDSGAIDNDNYAELKILHEGTKVGKITFIATIICTILTFFLPIFFLNAKINNMAVYIFVQLVIYEAMIGNGIAVAYSIFNNRRCKKHGYNNIGYFKASLWIALFGLAFGLTFVISLLVKSLVPSANPSTTPTNVGNLINFLISYLNY